MMSALRWPSSRCSRAWDRHTYCTSSILNVELTYVHSLQFNSAIIGNNDLSLLHRQCRSMTIYDGMYASSQWINVITDHLSLDAVFVYKPMVYKTHNAPSSLDAYVEESGSRAANTTIPHECWFNAASKMDHALENNFLHAVIIFSPSAFSTSHHFHTGTSTCECVGTYPSWLPKVEPQ